MTDPHPPIVVEVNTEADACDCARCSSEHLYVCDCGEGLIVWGDPMLNCSACGQQWKELIEPGYGAGV